MRTLAAVFLAALATPALGQKRIDLDTLIVRARRSPRVEAARSAASAAEAKVAEVSRTWIPQVELTAVGGPSPEIRCIPSAAECISTEPHNLQIGFAGAFFRAEARAIAPLYTFGKIAAGRRAADAGAAAARALADAAQADTVLDAVRAYHGLKVARELILMLDEGHEQAQKELKRVETALDKGKADVTEIDRHRVRAVLAEIDARLAEARRAEGTALAGVHFLSGDDRVDVDDRPLAAVTYELPADLAALRRRAETDRPEPKAATLGVRAAAALLDLERARWLPDLVLVGQATFARAGGVDDPQNAFANDPFNTTSFTVGVAARWSLDAGIRGARIQAAHAEEERAERMASFARQGVGFEVERAYSEARDARDRMVATGQGEKATRAWLVATAQATAAGLAEPKELVDALVANFTMRARSLQAIYDWNIAVASLQRAIGAGR